LEFPPRAAVAAATALENIFAASPGSTTTFTSTVASQLLLLVLSDFDPVLPITTKRNGNTLNCSMTPKNRRNKVDSDKMTFSYLVSNRSQILFPKLSLIDEAHNNRMNLRL
jgi:hypothetical protein